MLEAPCHTMTDNAQHKLLGNVAEIQNFLRITKINLWSTLETRGRGVHLHTLVDRDVEALQERGRRSRTRSDSDRG